MMDKQQFFSYNNKIVKWFAYATIIWGMVGMLIGMLASLQLMLPLFNFDSPFTTFGRVRPIHTNTTIFAFVGNGIFTGVYYSLQRLLKVRIFSDLFSQIHFWGWQLIIVLGVFTLGLGYTTGKEYAELEWPIDILLILIWIVFGWNMMKTVTIRKSRHIHISIWFYLFTFVTIAVLHIINSLELPISLTKSYSIYAGVQDANIQARYIHNIKAFFLIMPYLGLMYYFLPRIVGKPLFSYRISIVHFWALIFLFLWAGPDHLFYDSLSSREWARTVAIIFSLLLIIPSWAGMINGLLTLRSAWDKIRENPTFKFMLVAIISYGIFVFEDSLLSLQSVNAISHFTDWEVAHSHIGALGWNGFLTFGILYWLFPKLFNAKLYSNRLVNIHFWLGVSGIIVYVVPLYWAGITAALSLKELNENGELQTPLFSDVFMDILHFYHIRTLGGMLYIAGFIVMIYNLIKTAKSNSFVKDKQIETAPIEAPPQKEDEDDQDGMLWVERNLSKIVTGVAIVIATVIIGKVTGLMPSCLMQFNVPIIKSVRPYSALELQGRDIYIREGCHNCHSQMIRPIYSEIDRYGKPSEAGEFIYDYPSLWGSKRNGPDLAREGVGRLHMPSSWHYKHFKNPKKVYEKSIMPNYKWLLENDLDTTTTQAKIDAMIILGIPYLESYQKNANKYLREQAEQIAQSINIADENTKWNKEVVALIAYLQKLGRDTKPPY